MTNENGPTVAPGDDEDVGPGLASEPESSPRTAVVRYLTGLVLSALLTGASFYVFHADVIWKPAIPAALVALGIAQIGIHLVFFLHMTTAPHHTNNVMALAFGILIVLLIIGGSLWIMGHLNHNMMPMTELLRRQR